MCKPDNQASMHRCQDNSRSCAIRRPICCDVAVSNLSGIPSSLVDLGVKQGCEESDGASSHEVYLDQVTQAEQPQAASSLRLCFCHPILQLARLLALSYASASYHQHAAVACRQHAAR